MATYLVDVIQDFFFNVPHQTTEYLILIDRFRNKKNFFWRLYRLEITSQTLSRNSLLSDKLQAGSKKTSVRPTFLCPSQMFSQ